MHSIERSGRIIYIYPEGEHSSVQTIIERDLARRGLHGYDVQLRTRRPPVVTAMKAPSPDETVYIQLHLHTTHAHPYARFIPAKYMNAYR